MDTLSRIINLIEVRNIEQKELASALGILPETITNWKAGRSKSYLKFIIQISNYFGVSTDYLLGTSESEIQDSVTSIQQDSKENLNISPEVTRNFLIAKGVLKPGEPLTEELKNTCIDIMFRLLESNFEQYKEYFIKNSSEN